MTFCNICRDNRSLLFCFSSLVLTSTHDITSLGPSSVFVNLLVQDNPLSLPFTGCSPSWSFSSSFYILDKQIFSLIIFLFNGPYFVIVSLHFWLIFKIFTLYQYFFLKSPVLFTISAVSLLLTSSFFSLFH